MLAYPVVEYRKFFWSKSTISLRCRSHIFQSCIFHFPHFTETSIYRGLPSSISFRGNPGS